MTALGLRGAEAVNRHQFDNPGDLHFSSAKNLWVCWFAATLGRHNAP